MIRSPFETLILGMGCERGHRGDRGDGRGASEPFVFEPHQMMREGSSSNASDCQARAIGVVHYVSDLPGHFRRRKCDSSLMIYGRKCPVRF